MVAEKINSRGVGKVMGLTRQPTEGRRKGGGLRIGEMERDTVLSHGISNFIKESMMERSDKFSWCICKRCGTLVSYNIKENINMCKNCNNDDVAVIQTPYAFKLFIQELETMGIQPRLNTEFIDMPIDQAELVRSSNAIIDRDSGEDAGGGNNSDNEDIDTTNINDIDNDNDNDNYNDIDYTLFNSQIDNFATKNTIVDEKTWKDTYDNLMNKVKGGMYEEEQDEEEQDEEEQDEEEQDEEEQEEEEQEEEEQEEEEQDEQDEQEEEKDEQEEEEQEEDEEDEAIQEGGDYYEDEQDDDEFEGGSCSEEIWNDKEDDTVQDKIIKGGDNDKSDIKELYIEM